MNNAFSHETYIREDDNNSEKENNDFEGFLIQWAITHRISHVVLSHLLSGLKKVDPIFSNLPKYARTLLRTPRSSVITDIFPGQYCHFGIEYGILQFLSKSNSTISSSIFKFKLVLMVCRYLDSTRISYGPF